MKYKFKTVKTSSSLTLIFTKKKIGFTKVVVFTASHLNYQEAIDALHEYTTTSLVYSETGKATQEFLDHVTQLQDAKQVLNNWSNGSLEIKGQTVLYKGKNIDDTLAKFLLAQFVANPKETNALDAWTNFLNLVEDAGSYKVATRLFAFLQHNDLRITKEGKVLAWKVVRTDYKDIHSGTVDYTPGNTVEMDRKDVDDNDNSYCSHGLHVCAWGYLKSFARQGCPVLEVEIDVKDIVSIPLDYNGEKVRCSKVKSVREVGRWGIDVDAERLPKVNGYSAVAIA